MTLMSRTSSLLVVGVVGLLSPFALHALAQDHAPNKREITLTARNYRFNPARIEVSQDDLVKLTVQSEDNAYSVTIDEYRADRAGTFAFYSNLTNDARHAQMRGELIVRGK